MLTGAEINVYLAALNDELARLDVKGEVCLFGGAVMCLVYDARPSTKDVDGIFHPASVMREAIKRVGAAFNLPDDWLNDAVKGFVTAYNRELLFALSHLDVYVPPPDYLLAMKAMAARVDTSDQSDVRLLIERLELKSPDEVFRIIEDYYPRGHIKPATQFFIEEIFEQ